MKIKELTEREIEEIKKWVITNDISQYVVVKCKQCDRKTFHLNRGFINNNRRVECTECGRTLWED